MMEDLDKILREIQEDQRHFEEYLLDQELAILERIKNLQSEKLERFDELERETENLARCREARGAVQKRYRDLEREARRRYPEYPERHKKLERELRTTVPKVRELYELASGSGWVASIGKVEIRWQLFGGVLPCEICGTNITMGWAIVHYKDGRAVEIRDYLFHYIEANHPITYKTYWSAIKPITPGFYLRGPFSTAITIEEEVRRVCRHWLTDDNEIRALISMLADI